MPRDIPVGNGNLLVTFDAQYQLRDIYFPFVGMEDHTAGRIARINGRIAITPWSRTSCGPGPRPRNTARCAAFTQGPQAPPSETKMVP